MSNKLSSTREGKKQRPVIVVPSRLRVGTETTAILGASAASLAFLPPDLVLYSAVGTAMLVAGPAGRRVWSSKRLLHAVENAIAVRNMRKILADLQKEQDQYDAYAEHYPHAYGGKSSTFCLEEDLLKFFKRNVWFAEVVDGERIEPHLLPRIFYVKPKAFRPLPETTFNGLDSEKVRTEARDLVEHPGFDPTRIMDIIDDAPVIPFREVRIPKGPKKSRHKKRKDARQEKVERQKEAEERKKGDPVLDPLLVRADVIAKQWVDMVTAEDVRVMDHANPLLRTVVEGLTTIQEYRRDPMKVTLIEVKLVEVEAAWNELMKSGKPAKPQKVEIVQGLPPRFIGPSQYRKFDPKMYVRAYRKSL